MFGSQPFCLRPVRCLGNPVLTEHMWALIYLVLTAWKGRVRTTPLASQ